MPLDPNCFLDQARRLANDAENEADYRSAISRAYYACHLVARDALFRVWGASPLQSLQDLSTNYLTSTIPA